MATKVKESFRGLFLSIHQHHFRLCILALYAAHVVAPRLLAVYIRHSPNLRIP